jgi:hypothetical protein
MFTLSGVFMVSRIKSAGAYSPKIQTLTHLYIQENNISLEMSKFYDTIFCALISVMCIIFTVVQQLWFTYLHAYDPIPMFTCILINFIFSLFHLNLVAISFQMCLNFLICRKRNREVVVVRRN